MGGIILFVYFFCKCNLKRTFIVIWWVGSQNTIENWYRSRGHISGILILKFYDSPLYIDVNRNVKTRESIKVIISQLQFPFPSHLSVPTLYTNPSSNFSIRRHISSLSLSLHSLIPRSFKLWLPHLHLQIIIKKVYWIFLSLFPCL